MTPRRSTASPWRLRLATTCSGSWRGSPASRAGRRGTTRPHRVWKPPRRISRSDSDRLRARLLLAEVQLEAGRPVDSVEILEQVLADERLRGLTVGSEDGHRAIRADLLIADRLASIVRQRGREVYAKFDHRASELFERGRQEQDPRLLDEVSRIYPVAARGTRCPPGAR